MTLSMAERHRLAMVAWFTTVATSLCLFTAMQEKRYVLIAAGLSALCVGLGMLLRQARVPMVVIVAAQLVLPLWLLLLAYGHHTKFSVLPTISTFNTVHDKISSGFQIAQNYSAPVPPSAGLTLVTVAFVVVIAVLVDLITAGLGQAPVAGLPLLAMYVVPVASLPNGVPMLGFLPGAAMYVALLMLFERDKLAHWGRRVARSAIRDSGEALDTSGLSSTGRRISVLAVAGAVVLPLLIPGLSHTFIHGSGGVGDGSGHLSFADPLVGLSSDLHLGQADDLIDVTSATEPTYLRLAVLDQPGPIGWRNSGILLNETIPATTVLPAPPGLSAAIRSRSAAMTLALTKDFPSDSAWLPVPYDIENININQVAGSDPYSFSYVPRDQTVTTRAKDAISQVEGYEAFYRVPEPTAAQLEAATGQVPANIVTQFTTVPGGVPAIVAQDARQITAGSSSQYEAALDLQSFFRKPGQFTYDLNTGYGTGYDAMATFLQKRRGYCQHFAATMAMMAREVGIPSRVVVGFLDPTRRLKNHAWVFTSHDAHAWPELYFAGLGWVRFEPTPGNGATIPSYTHLVPVPNIDRTVTDTSSAVIIGKPTGVTDTTTSGATAVPGSHHTPGSGSGTPWLGWLVALLVVALFFGPALVRIGVRRARLARAVDGGPSCEHAWLELRDRIVDLRLPWSGALTPRARHRFVEPLLGGDPDAVAALDRLVITVERSRYAQTSLPQADPAGDAKAIMAALARETSRGTRVRAFLWPRSLMPEARLGWRHWRTRLRRLRPAT